MRISTSRALTIISNNGVHIKNLGKLPKDLREKTAQLIESFKPEMMGEGINPNAVLEYPTLMLFNLDVNRMGRSDIPHNKVFINRFGRLWQGFAAIWTKLTDEGLGLALEICDSVDEIADFIAGEDDD